MTNRAKKIKVGIFVVAIGALVAGVLIIFGGMRFWEGRDTYYVLLDDSAIGLEPGAHVLFNGIRVGEVQAMETLPEDLTKVRVTIEIKEGVPIKTDTQAMLKFLGITGLKIIDLRGGAADAPALPPGHVIANGETTLDRFERKAKELMEGSTELMASAKRILDQTEVVATNLAALTDPAPFEDLPTIVATVKRASVNLAATTGVMREMVTENRAALKQTLASVDQAAQSASQLLDDNVARLVTDASSFVNDLSSVVRDNQTQMRSAMTDVRQASRSFKELARELRQKPSRLLFSDSLRDRKLP
jgi:phospholipid/cholesterol/gamma-HCH transport system substrate-binding protein